MAVKDAKDLTVYQKAYRLAMDVFETSKTFPSEERYAHCGYITLERHAGLVALNTEVGKMLRSMIESPDKFLTPSA